jgi:hypothetical protein
MDINIKNTPAAGIPQEFLGTVKCKKSTGIKNPEQPNGP